MKLISLKAVVERDQCNGCVICTNVCPTLAISVQNNKAVVKEEDCRGCGACDQRCPTYAISMRKIEVPYTVAVATDDVPYEKIVSLCKKANMHPEQLVCYCTATRAEEVAAGILKGAATPEELSRTTGIRTGCKVECIEPVLRLLEAAGISPQPPKGWQWYGLTPTVWNIPEEVKAKYGKHGFYFEEDIQLFDQVREAKSGRRDS